MDYLLGAGPVEEVKQPSEMELRASNMATADVELEDCNVLRRVAALDSVICLEHKLCQYTDNLPSEGEFRRFFHKNDQKYYFGKNRAEYIEHLRKNVSSLRNGMEYRFMNEGLISRSSGRPSTMTYQIQPELGYLWTFEKGNVDMEEFDFRALEGLLVFTQMTSEEDEAKRLIYSIEDQIKKKNLENNGGFKFNSYLELSKTKEKLELTIVYNFLKEALEYMVDNGMEQFMPENLRDFVKKTRR